MPEHKKINTKINFGSQPFKKYLANTSWLFGEKAFRLVIGFFINIYVIRYLGPSQFGLLSYAISFVMLFSAIAALGLDNIVVRDLVKESEKRNELLGSAFFLRLIGAVISLLLIALGVVLTSESSYNIILISIIAVSSIFQAFNVIDFYFQSTVKIKYSVYVRTFAFIIPTVIKLFLIIYKYELIYFAIVTSLENILMSIGFIVVYQFNKLKIFQWQVTKSRALQLLKDSWPLILSGLVISIYMKIDQIMIKKMLTDTEVGLYAAAVKISEAWYFIPLSISSSLFPAIINAKKNSEILYLNRLQKLYDLLAGIAIAISVPVTFWAGDIINILLGVKYLPAASVMTIYIWAGVAVFLSVASSQFLVSENLTKVAFLRSFIGMIINVILNLIFIPSMGIVGSAWATLFSYTIATLSIGFSNKTGNHFIMIIKSFFLINLIKEFYRFFKK